MARPPTGASGGPRQQSLSEALPLRSLGSCSQGSVCQRSCATTVTERTAKGSGGHHPQQQPSLGVTHPAGCRKGTRVHRSALGQPSPHGRPVPERLSTLPKPQRPPGHGGARRSKPILLQGLSTDLCQQSFTSSRRAKEKWSVGPRPLRQSGQGRVNVERSGNKSVTRTFRHAAASPLPRPTSTLHSARVTLLKADQIAPLLSGPTLPGAPAASPRLSRPPLSATARPPLSATARLPSCGTAFPAPAHAPRDG